MSHVSDPRPSVALLPRLAGAVPGAVLGTAARVGALVRRDKPLHPEGRVGEGVLDVTAPAPEVGVPLLAAAGPQPCLARWSRALGLPDAWPDIEGLALRFPDAGGGVGADVLFAGTGTGTVSRYLLRPRLRHHVDLTTLLPVSSAAGPLLFAVRPLVDDDSHDPPTRFSFSFARGSGPWTTVGTLGVAWGPDQAQRFDPVAHPLPGTRQYPFVSRLRRPAYRAAQESTDAHA